MLDEPTGCLYNLVKHYEFGEDLVNKFPYLFKERSKWICLIDLVALAEFTASLEEITYELQ